MACPPLPTQHLKAGEEYLAAVKKLGMRPVFCGWGWETLRDEWSLTLISSIVDEGGPFALNKLLFRAYNSGVTPKEVSPFIVHVFSPDVRAFDTLRQVWRIKPGDLVTSPQDARARTTVSDYITITVFGTEYYGKYAYDTAIEMVPKYHKRREEWDRFRRNVEKLAA